MVPPLKYINDIEPKKSKDNHNNFFFCITNVAFQGYWSTYRMILEQLAHWKTKFKFIPHSLDANTFLTY